MRRRGGAQLAEAPLETLAVRARGGDGGAAEELAVRLYPAVFRLTAALVGDPEVAESTTREAFDRALATDATPFTEVVVREARDLGRQRRSDDAVGLGPLSDVDRSVVVLVDVEGRRYHEVATLLGLSAPEVAMAHARARDHLGIDLNEQRCVGWSLVSRADDLTGPEATAVRGHLDLCRECAAGVRERHRARTFLLAHLPEPATMAVATGLFASVITVARQPAVLGGAAVTAAAAAVGLTIALSGGQPPAAPEPSTAPAAAATDEAPTSPVLNASESAPDDVALTPDDAPPQVEPEVAPEVAPDVAPGVVVADEPPGEPTPEVVGEPAPTPPAVSVPPPADRHDPPVRAQALIATTADALAASTGRIAGHLGGLGFATDERVGAAVTAANVVAWVATADERSDDLLVVHLSFEVAATVAPSFRFTDGTVPAADVASRLPDGRPTVVVLDLFGIDRPDVAAFIAAFAGTDRIVVGGFTAVTEVVGDGATALTEALWDQALIGGAGDADDDDRVSVEEAFAHAGRVGVQRGWTALPEADDRHEGATHLA